MNRFVRRILQQMEKSCDESNDIHVSRIAANIFSNQNLQLFVTQQLINRDNIILLLH